MRKFKDITVMDLNEEDSELTHRGWTIVFCLSAEPTADWQELFSVVMSKSWWAPYMFASNGRITVHRVRPWQLRFFKWAVERNVAETNNRYRRWLANKDNLSRNADADVQVFRHKLFGRKRKREI